MTAPPFAAICPACEKPVRPVHYYKSGTPRCLPMTRWTAARRWRLMGMIEAGMSDEEIGHALGVSGPAILSARHRHGIPSRQRAFLQETLDLGPDRTIR